MDFFPSPSPPPPLFLPFLFEFQPIKATRATYRSPIPPFVRAQQRWIKYFDLVRAEEIKQYDGAL